MKGIEARESVVDSFPGNLEQADFLQTPEVTEKCGVLGWIAWDNPNADLSSVQDQFLDATRALQHRGQQRTGIRGVSLDGEVTSLVGKGRISDILSDDQDIDLGVENSGIIHTTWTTDLSPGAENTAHPIDLLSGNKRLIISHNGQFGDEVNNDNIHPNDTTAIAHDLMKFWSGQQEPDPFEALAGVLSEVDGSYSIVAKFIDGDDEFLYAVRDPRAIRPLVYGVNENGVVVASETGALDQFGAEQLGEIDKGHIYRFDRDGGLIRREFAQAPRKSCIFENIYLTRKTHIDYNGVKIEDQRRTAGELIAELFTEEEVAEIQANKDDYIVVPMPATAIPAAEGLASVLGIKYEPDAIKVSKAYSRSYIGTAEATDEALEAKFVYDAEKIKGMRMLIVDDSLVRGKTSAKVIKILEDYGANEIHFLLSSPRIENTCDLGADIKREVLMAPGKTNQEIAEALGGGKLKSVRYLPLDKLVQAIGSPETDFCTGCINGNYATDYPISFVRGALERWLVRPAESDTESEIETRELARV